MTPDQANDAPPDPVYGVHEVAALTVRVIEAVCVRLPLVPLTVNVYVPAAVDEDVVTLSVDEPEPPLIEAGLKLVPAPAGTPVALKLTEPVNPFCGDTETV